MQTQKEAMNWVFVGMQFEQIANEIKNGEVLVNLNKY